MLLSTLRGRLTCRACLFCVHDYYSTAVCVWCTPYRAASAKVDPSQPLAHWLVSWARLIVLLMRLPSSPCAPFSKSCVSVNGKFALDCYSHDFECVDQDAFDQDNNRTYLAPGYVRTELHDKLTNAKREDLSSFMVSAWTPTVLATHENVCVCLR